MKRMESPSLVGECRVLRIRYLHLHSFQAGCAPRTNRHRMAPFPALATSSPHTNPTGQAVTCLSAIVFFPLWWHRCVKNQLHIGAEFRTFSFLLLGRFASWERTDDTSEGLQMLRLEGQFWRVWTVRTPFFVHGGCKKSLTLVAINFTWSISNTEGWLIMCFGLSIGIEKKTSSLGRLGPGKPWSTSRLPAFKACCAADFSASFGVSLSSPAYSWRQSPGPLPQVMVNLKKKRNRRKQRRWKWINLSTKIGRRHRAR